VPYQKCPICNGSGQIWDEPNLNYTGSTVGFKTCDVCHGSKIIPMSQTLCTCEKCTGIPLDSLYDESK